MLFSSVAGALSRDQRVRIEARRKHLGATDGYEATVSSLAATQAGIQRPA